MKRQSAGPHAVIIKFAKNSERPRAGHYGVHMQNSRRMS